MATQSVTTRIPFDHIPVAEEYLFEVREGVDAFFALSQAGVLYAAVQELLGAAVSNDEALTGNLAYLCEFAMEAAKGLRTAAGAVA